MDSEKWTRKTVVIWTISVISGGTAFLALAIMWIIYMWNYIAYQRMPTPADTIIAVLLALYVLAPAWIGYYLSDRTLFYDEYIKDPKNS